MESLDRIVCEEQLLLLNGKKTIFPETTGSVKIPERAYYCVTGRGKEGIYIQRDDNWYVLHAEYD